MKTDRPSFGIHAISWEPTEGSDGSDSEMAELVDSDSDFVNFFMKSSSSESDDQQVHEVLNPKVRRTRAAPFFDELMPGWRARARELVPTRGRVDPTFPLIRHAVSSRNEALP